MSCVTGIEELSRGDPLEAVAYSLEDMDVKLNCGTRVPITHLIGPFGEFLDAAEARSCEEVQVVAGPAPDGNYVMFCIYPDDKLLRLH